ncbi:MAG: hypothetical protein ACPGSC_14445, partial [Granulosicoccaceae bacterium]
MSLQTRASLAFSALLFAVLLSVLALGSWTYKGKKNIADILLVIDITQSMNVVDMHWQDRAVSRLEFTKLASQQMLLRWPCGSQLALALFTGHRSFVLFRSVEVCAHHAELHAALGALDWRSAWVARSEVSKGLYSALKVRADVGEKTRVVFVSDGHEAPPLHEKFRPRLPKSLERVGGVIIGVGADHLSRIPKFGPQGESQGFWRASEVMQVDSYRMGRGNGEALVGVDQSDLQQRIAAGVEHLSSLKTEHLQ